MDLSKYRYRRDGQTDGHGRNFSDISYEEAKNWRQRFRESESVVNSAISRAESLINKAIASAKDDFSNEGRDLLVQAERIIDEAHREASGWYEYSDLKKVIDSMKSDRRFDIPPWSHSSISKDGTAYI
ncbi:MAG: hypothetical protein HOP29_11335 [Phycisphaerales bacterium]|nr:hypothetical protein [Phycisphaerales bacterium]